MNDEDKPAAYDIQGRPLYYRPQTNLEPQQVHVVKHSSPEPVEISDAVMQKTRESRQKYPNLNLSDGEYVISAVKRHPLGLISIWASVIVVSLVILMIPLVFQSGAFALNTNSVMFGSAILIALLILIFLIGSVATMVYQGNRFYLTNESVIQHIQTSLFAQNNQTVSLANIEDASFRQVGILQSIFGYGSIRLSTQGDETTYRFSWVSNPKRQIDLLNNAVEAFKNGRPVEG